MDRRTDIWAFGCCLYECLTGERAFRGGTVTDTLAAVLNKDPDWDALSEDVPLVARRLLRRCLAKDARHRLQHIGDARVELEEIGIDASEPSAHARWSSRAMSALLIVVAAAVATTALLLLWLSPAAKRAPLIRFDLIVPPEIRVEEYHGGAISPDGQHFAVSAIVDGRQQLVLRHMGSTALVPLTGTEGGFAPFWSPDSQSIGFFHFDGYLRQVLLTGGPVRRLADATSDGPNYGGTWRGGVILFGAHKGRIYRVAPTGGTASALETLPWTSGQKAFASPRFLPDGRHFLVSVVDDPALYLASLDTPGTRKLMEDGSSAVYAAGHLFYSRGTRILARPFDAQRLEFSGAEVQVTEGTGDVSVSDDGTIVYRPAGLVMSRLTWFDRSGQRTGTVGEPGPYEQLVLSPRGRRATVVRPDAQGFADLWDVDLASRIFSRLTTDPADDSNPSWSPDERALAFSSTRTGRSALFVKDLVSGKEDPLVAFDERVALDQWTPDGRFVVFRTFGKAVYAAPLSGERTPRMLVDTPFIEDEVHVSPDGRWVAFNANESGRWEVYVAAFPAFTSKRQISSGGGVQPQWRADGRELFYLAQDSAMMSVRVDTRAGLTASPPARLFATNIAWDFNVPKFGVTSDGQRFLGLEVVGGGTSFTFLLNWLNAKSADGSGSER